MSKFIIHSAFIVLLALLSIGCSSQKPNPTIPENPSSQVPYSDADNQTATTTNHQIWGIWQIEIDTENLTARIESPHNLQMHMNITRLIPPPTIVIKSFDPVTHVIEVDVTLRNPYNITGYDIRAIIYHDEIGHLLANPDGYTSLFDKPGGADINPYKAYAKELTNREFGPFAEFTEKFQIYIPPGGGHVSFCIDASWPDHCEEPYDLDAFDQHPVYDIPGSHGHLQMEILDWQDDVNSVIIYAPQITDEPFTNLEYLEEFIWQLELTNNANAPVGEYTCLVKATSEGSAELAFYDYVILQISQARTPVALVYPNGGEEWYFTTSQMITWEAVVSITDIKIELSMNSGLSYDYVIADSTPNEGSFEWQIDLATVGDNTRIRVSDVSAPEVYDESDSDFRIICQIPPIPENVNASKAVDPEWIRVQWSPSQYATGYNIYRDSVLIVENFPETTYFDYDVQLDNHYFYEVSALNDCGESERSSPPQEGWLDSPITDWTFLVYLHESNLGTYAIQDINEMEAVGSVEGDLDIVVLWDKEGTPDDVILHIQKDPDGLYGPIISPEIEDNGAVIPPSGTVMGDGVQLEKFLRWAIQNYPAQHYGLVLWDHGDGPFSIIGDEGFIRSCCNGLQIWEIRNACQTVLNENPEIGRLDFIGFDACLMGWLEITYCLKNVCKATIGSEMLEPGQGWKYNLPLTYLKNNIATCTNEDFCEQIVISYLNSTGSGTTLAAASTDLMSDYVIPSLNTFSSELMNIVSTRKNDIRNIRSTVGRWGAYCNETHVRDIGYFSYLVSQATFPSSLINAAAELDLQIENAMIAHGHNGSGTGCPYSESGWQIWFPSNYDDSSNSQKRSDYNKLGFTSTQWDEFLSLYDNY